MTQSLEPRSSRTLQFYVQTKLEAGAMCDGEASKYFSFLEGGTRKAHRPHAKVTVLNMHWWQVQDQKLFNCYYLTTKNSSI